jgi:hypothetical protein
MEPIKPQDRLQILAAQPDSEAEIAEHEQLLAERFLEDPDAPAVQAAPDPAAYPDADLDVPAERALEGGTALDAVQRDLEVDDRDASAPVPRGPSGGSSVDRAPGRSAQREARLRALHRKLYGPPRTR